MLVIVFCEWYHICMNTVKVFSGERNHSIIGQKVILFPQLSSVFIMSVDFCKIESKLGSDFFPEVIAQILDLRTISDCGVWANSYFLFFLDSALLLKESWINNRVGSFFSHADWMIGLINFGFNWIIECLIVDEHV